MELVRRAIPATFIILACVTGPGCAEAVGEQSPAVRLVERELRREFNTRYIHVSQPTPDTLSIAITGGRLVKGATRAVSLSEIERATIARRAIEILAPDSARPSTGVAAVTVEITQGRRLGPLVFDRKRERSAHPIHQLLATRASGQPLVANDSSAIVRLEAPQDSSR